MAAVAAVAGEIPARPEQLKFPPLKFDVPDAGALRVKLANGIPCYIATDRMLPLVTVQVLFRGGQYMEPAGKEGLAELTGAVWRTGGAGKLDARALDEELDFLAASLSTSVGGVSGSVSLNLLSKDVDRGLALLMDVLREPRFDEARLAKAKEDMLSEMKRRNDETEAIEDREWDRLVYGDDYWLNRLATKASVDGITRDDLVAFHKRLANPANFVIAVAGDFDRAAMIAKLNATLGSWKASAPAAPPVPQPSAIGEAGRLRGRQARGQSGPRVDRPHRRQAPASPTSSRLTVANDILGGGGFTAWMMSRVRSDEGLAYSAYSGYSDRRRIPRRLPRLLPVQVLDLRAGGAAHDRADLQDPHRDGERSGAGHEQELVHRDASAHVREQARHRGALRSGRDRGATSRLLEEIQRADGRGHGRRRPDRRQRRTSSRTSSSSSWSGTPGRSSRDTRTTPRRASRGWARSCDFPCAIRSRLKPIAK